jgi:hypothetical protein
VAVIDLLDELPPKEYSSMVYVERGIGRIKKSKIEELSKENLISSHS